MRLFLTLIVMFLYPFVVPHSVLAEGSPIARGTRFAAIVQSLSTGTYYPATVEFVGQQAKLTVRGAQILVDLDDSDADIEEAEEILAIDGNDNYWAIYIDWPRPLRRHDRAHSSPLLHEGEEPS
jgi:hypothetical protein